MIGEFLVMFFLFLTGFIPLFTLLSLFIVLVEKIKGHIVKEGE